MAWLDTTDMFSGGNVTDTNGNRINLSKARVVERRHLDQVDTAQYGNAYDIKRNRTIGSFKYVGMTEHTAYEVANWYATDSNAVAAVALDTDFFDAANWSVSPSARVLFNGMNPTRQNNSGAYMVTINADYRDSYVADTTAGV